MTDRSFRQNTTAASQSLVRKLRSVWTTVFREHKVPWKVLRLYYFLRLNNFRLVLVPLRFAIRRPGLRVVLSTTFFGGVGGTEKLVATVIESMRDCEFLVFASEVKSRGFVPRSWNYRLNIPILRRGSFDVYLYFCGGGKPKYLGDTHSFKARVVDTNASDIRDIEDRFDCILVQAEDYDRYTTRHDKCVVAFPEIASTIPEHLEPVADLPDTYVLTVFNPFVASQKSQDLLVKAAEVSRLPIVWCFSDVTYSVGKLANVSNLIPLKNLSQRQLYFVYKRAAAYISLSTYESFGWSLAEAFFMGLPIVSRRTGIIAFVADQPGIHTYSNDEELWEILRRAEFRKPSYDRSVFL